MQAACLGVSDGPARCPTPPRAEARWARTSRQCGSTGEPAVSSDITLAGPDVQGLFGTSVASDMNGDGLADLAVGTYFATMPITLGKVYVYLGSATGVDWSPSFTLDPPMGSGRFRVSVASAWGVNGDGYADGVVATAPCGPPMSEP